MPEREPEAAIDAMYAALLTGDVDGALRWCTEDAEWHSVTPSPTPGSMPARAYFELLLRFLSENPDYKILEQDRHRHGNLVVSLLRTSLGEGTMTFRVVDGLVSDAWVINARGRAATGYF